MNTKRGKGVKNNLRLIIGIIVTNRTPGFCAYAQLFPSPFSARYHPVGR
jgi:hypothetical protein